LYLEGRRKFGSGFCNGCNGCNGYTEEGRRKKEEGISCYAFKLEIRDRLEARPTKVLLIFDTQFKC
jgi:hypothetical protein